MEEAEGSNRSALESSGGPPPLEQCASLRYGRLFTGERLQAFSDAVFAIIITIMVIPLKLTQEEADKHEDEEFFLRDYLYGLWPKYLVYAFSFMVVSGYWYKHTRIFTLIHHVDDALVWINMVLLLFISFLPYSIGLLSEFQQESGSLKNFELVVFILGLNIFMIELTTGGILLYVVLRKSLLHHEAVSDPEFKLIKTGLFSSVAGNCVCALLAMACAFIPKLSVLSMLFLYATGLFSYVIRFTFYAIHKKRTRGVVQHTAHIFRKAANKERTEAFSDGVFSIVATLILLDLTTQDLPSVSEVRDHFNDSIQEALKEKATTFTAYVLSFFVIGLLYMTHYGMFYYIKTVTPFVSLLNTATLALVCLIPFLSGLLNIYAGYRNTANIVAAVRVTTVVVFLAGCMQLMLWTSAVLNKGKCLSDEINKPFAESVQFAKGLVFPIACLITYLSTFSNAASHYVFTVLISLSIVVVLLVEASVRICQKHVLKERGERSLLDSGETFSIKTLQKT